MRNIADVHPESGASKTDLLSQLRDGGPCTIIRVTTPRWTADLCYIDDIIVFSNPIYKQMVELNQLTAADTKM